MRLKISKSKNAQSFYVIQSTYIDRKRSTKIVEKLGTLEEVKKKADGQDPIEWAKKYIEELTKKEKEGNREIIKSYSPTKIIDKDKQIKYNCGYLFIQDIYYKLGINRICNNIENKYKFQFILNDIMSRLIYGRIIEPSSKLSTYSFSKTLIEQPTFQLHDIYRALEVISKESDFIQSELYKNSSKYCERNNRVLYYDCTNFFFEIEQDDDFRKYGVSKEHRPNPIVQMGLFMDGDGIPLSFDMNPGNTNENKTLKPLEEKIIKDFNLSTIVVCTDAGLASKANRKFNNTNDRKFITTQSIKQLKQDLKDWALDKTGWHIPNLDNTVIDISKLDENEELRLKWKDTTFYKEKWIKDSDGFEQKMIVTYSIKYAEYQRNIRNNQIKRASNLINSNPTKIGKSKQNDFKRFISTTVTTDDGKEATKKEYFINQDIIQEEMKYDGFYAVCTNLEDNPIEIIKVNHKRWEIEESFRIMKSEFDARPVYLQREDRIKAHFMICFIALMIYRYLEKKLDYKYTVCEIIDTLRNMQLIDEDGDGFRPIYTRTDLTDLLHDKFGFRNDYQILNNKNLKKVLSQTKK